MIQNLYLQKGNGGISLLLVTLGHALHIAGVDPQKTTMLVTTWVTRFQQPLLIVSPTNHKWSLERRDNYLLFNFYFDNFFLYFNYFITGFTNKNKNIIVEVDVIHGPCLNVVLAEIWQVVKLSNPFILELGQFIFQLICWNRDGVLD